MSKQRLEGKVVIITGAASGIGAESARLFAENGAVVVIADIQDELGRNVAVSIGEEKASYVHCDVREESQVENAVKFALEKHGRLDVFFSNAGVLEKASSILDLDLDELDRTMATNVRGAAAAIKHAGRAMVAAHGTRSGGGGGGGSIICTTSVASEVAGTAPHAYTAAKHALVGLVRSACAELGHHGIRVNGVSPFGVATPLVCAAYGLEAGQVEENSCAAGNMKGVVLTARHVAEAALFLASDESVYVSGHNLAVDGGFSVVRH